MVGGRTDAPPRAFPATALLLREPASLREAGPRVQGTSTSGLGGPAQGTRHGAQGNAWQLPLFPFSSRAAKSTAFSRRTEQMVGRSCWAARCRAVWRCLVSSFTLAPARSC